MTRDYRVFRVDLSVVDGDTNKPGWALRNVGLEELEEIERLVASAGYSERVRIDPSVVRGLEYYTGPVYEVELTARHQGRKRPPGALRFSRRRRTL